jgi:hypothetical protein
VNRRDIIAIGASAGGVEALKQVVSVFSSDFDASIFVVLHVNRGMSMLPDILTRAAGSRPVSPTMASAFFPVASTLRRPTTISSFNADTCT